MFNHLWDRVRVVVSNLKSRRSENRPERPKHRPGTVLHAELLEPRQYLSANQISLNTGNSTLTIQGTTGNDSAKVWVDTSNVVHVTLDTPAESLSATFARASVTSIRFVGDAGDDRFENTTNIDCFASGELGNDILVGGTGVNYFLGGGGNDQLYGNIAADWLYGDDGADLIYGGAGNDRLEGGTGNDTMYGGAGDDSILGGDGDDTLSGDDGSDWAHGGAGNDVISGGIGDDQLVGDIGNDQLSGDDGADKLYSDDGDDLVNGGAGNDTLYGSTGADTLNGGLGDDTLYGDDGNDRLNGDDGNDWIDGGDGNDTLTGGLGNDTLQGEAGDDYLSGNDGNDTLSGQDGNDYLDGGAGDDSLFGDNGNDIFHGGAGDDAIVGGDGGDQLYGEEGNDWLSGDAGNDVLYGGAEVDRLEGGAGDDALYGGVGDDSLLGGDGNDIISGDEDNDWAHGGSGNDAVYGGDGDDTLIGGDGDDWLIGQIGSDQLDGESGNDYLDGGDGNDGLSGGIGDDTLYGGTGNNALVGGDGNDRLYGGTGQDWLSGDAGNDTLYGGNGVDRLEGGAGDDALYGGGGDDSLLGGDGNDALSGDDGNDWLHGGSGNDMLYGGNGNDTLIGAEGDDWLFGQADDDQLNADVGNDYLEGGAGDDSLNGGIGDDTLYGGIGNNSLIGGDGNDRLYGGIGQDSLAGDAGNDTLYGNTGVDRLEGGAGNDVLYGGAGDDSLLGGDGNDMLFGDDGNDWEHGGNGDDLMYGGAGDDKFYGGDGNDILSGDAGNDYLETGLGRAVLLGGAGDDQLFGGDSSDVLIGGSGKDSLLGHAGDDLLIGGSTDYDNDATTMRWVLAAWSNGAYDARVQTITDTLFTTDVVDGDDPAVHTSVAGGHLIDDQVSDSLSGEGGQDWFLESGYMPMWLPSNVDSELQGDVNSVVLCGEQVMYLTNQVPSLEGFNLFDSLDVFGDRQTSETITSMVPKADNVSLEKEHLALMQLVRYDQVTDYAIRSGDWSDPAIWNGGVVPASDARVLIPVGVEVNVDAMIPARLSTVRVDGTLSFDTAHNSQLQVDTLVVSDCGEFEMGTADEPIARGVTARLLITDNGAIDRNWDPYGISRGLIAQGAVSIFGSQVDSYSALVGSVTAGTQTLSLTTVPTGWKIGDSVVVAATTPGVTQDETRLITAIAGNLVQLDRPLNYSHTAPSGGFQINVANLTRNAVIESEASSADRNGHVMFMHSHDVDISYGGFYNLGRTDKSKPINDPVIQSDWTLKPGTGTNPRARYAVHFHRAGADDAGDPAVVTGSVVDGGPGWGFVNHSSNVDMIDNVAYGVNGAAFVSEVGDEIGGFYSNLAIGTTGTNEEPEAREGIQDFGFRGDGFWFQGAGLSVVGNISAGNQGDAFAYYTRGLFQGEFLTKNLLDPSIAKGAPSIPVGQVPIREFNGNVGYASNVGLRLRYHLQDVTQGQRSLVEDSQFWNNTTGMWLDYDQNTTYRNVTVTTAQFQMLGVRGGGQTASNLTFENLNVSGYYGGIDMPRRGTLAIIGGSFNNISYDIRLFNAIIYDRFVTISGLTGQPKIRADFDMTPIPGYSATAAFVNDVVLLNFGQFVNQRLYNSLQTATAVPFGTPRPDMPSQYVGLTNQQLWNQFGKAFGGTIAPSNAITAPNIVGLIAPKV